MGNTFCVVRHLNRDNCRRRTEVGVSRNRSSAVTVYQIADLPNDERGISLRAAKQWFADQRIDADPIDFVRDHKLERGKVGYAVRVRALA